MAARTVVGLEITQHAVRMAEVRPGHHPVVVRAAVEPLLPGVAHDSEVLDAAAVTDAIRRLRAATRFSTRRVVLGINSWRVLVREFTTPLTDRAQIIESLPFEVHELLPMPVEKATMDFYPTDAGEHGSRGLLVAAASDAIEALLRAIEDAGIEVDTIDLVAFGLARLAPVVSAPDEVVAMVHVGRHTTAMTVVSQGIPRFIRMLPAEIPFPDESDDAATDTAPGRVNLRRATERATAERASAEAAESLAARLRSTVQYYLGQGAPAAITRVRLSGSGALHPAVAPRIRDALGVPVDHLDPDAVAYLNGIEPTLAQDLVSTIALTLGADR